MAQCARLNLRMQKELKLLLTDPPPGAAFPNLSDDPSLTSIDAILQGPEGTVYANGVFRIKIQIPERYPFQPPIVVFATPIYHPNIDNGGRICLDILNLPPKGMWQPSLNISTVLTSIGLLLSEPNPDDGLMPEASREYKYNRQAFDQNARSMTEKYARAGGSTHACRNTAQPKMDGSGMPVSIIEHRKLSLGSSSNNEDSGKEICSVSTHDQSQKLTEFQLLKEANIGKVQATRNKLTLKLPVCSSRKDESEKENLTPVSEYGMSCNETRPKTGITVAKDVMSDKKQQQINEVCVGESSDKLTKVVEAEDVIVLDSEDESEDEVVPMRSKLSIARRCLLRKRKMASDR